FAMSIAPARKFRCAVGWVLAIAAAPAIARAVDGWPQFRGPDGQGHAVASQLPATWSENENIRWKTAMRGLGWSSPVVMGDRIWLTTSVDLEQSLRLVCLARESGKVLHDVEVFRAEDLGRIASKNSHASPTPVVDGRHVFVHYGAHGTACLTADGEVVWTRKLEYDQRHGPGGSPVVWNDLVIVSCDGMDAQYTVALDKQTGEVRWQADHPGLQAYSTPLVIDVQGTPQLVTSGGEALIAYAPADGRELWRFRHGGHSVVPRPVAGNGLVYFCTGYWTPTLVAVRSDGSGDVTDSHLAYRMRHSVPHTPSPLLIGKRIYFVSDQGVLTCGDAVDGNELWRQRLGGNFSASLTLADGKIYCLDEDGTMHVLAEGETFKKLAENHLDGRTLATPAFVENAIYLRTDRHLYCIEAVAAAESRTIKAGATLPSGSKPKFLR
ncbi:MAG: PQQ-binding-like beta-propeller repeat protein, partial [Pirellulales bacterium]